jgi:crotonobetainyl-CoA:carnitine CoA-transferase CaiB-like acyl-CoA transferase
MKLTGVRVVDLSQFLPGPMLTLMMADHGADVIKVEPPSGDPAREMAPFQNGQSVWFRTTNRGKSSLALDLKTDAGKAALSALLENADVMVESFRPGVMARLGFDYDTVSAKNPRIVYCSLSAFGQTNPWADHPAHDIAAQALGGFLSVNDVPDGTPVVPGVPASDMAASLTGLSAVLMALLAREKSGRGDYVDISMQQSLMPWCGHIAGTAMTGGESPQSATQRSLGGAAFYNIYETSDGRHIVLAGRELKFARTLLKALGREDLIPLAEAEAGPAQKPLKDFLASMFITKSRDDWTAWFHDKDVAFAPVLNFAESFQHPAIQALAYDVKGNAQLAPAFTFASEADKILPDAPRLGENHGR